MYILFELSYIPSISQEKIENNWKDILWNCWWVKSKPSLKIRIATAICWIYLGLFRDYELNFFQHLFEKKIVKPYKISTHSEIYDRVEIL